MGGQAGLSLPPFPPLQFLDCCPSSRTSCCNHAVVRAGRNVAVVSCGASAGFRQPVVVVVDTLMLAPPPATSSQVLLWTVTPVWVNSISSWYEVIVNDWLVMWPIYWHCDSDPLGAFIVLFINIFFCYCEPEKYWLTFWPVVKVWPEVRRFGCYVWEYMIWKAKKAQQRNLWNCIEITHTFELIFHSFGFSFKKARSSLHRDLRMLTFVPRCYAKWNPWWVNRAEFPAKPVFQRYQTVLVCHSLLSEFSDYSVNINAQTHTEVGFSVSPILQVVFFSDLQRLNVLP